MPSIFLNFFHKHFPLNKIIKVLILADFVLLTGFGFILPVFAVFIVQYVQGGSVMIAGLASSVYWIILSLILIPVAKYLDKNHGEKDDLCFISIGTTLGAIAVFGFIFAYLPWHIYLLQGLYAIGMGINIPGYTAVFTRHIEKGKEALSWSTRAALIGVGAGVAGALGGVVVHFFGFQILFLGVTILLLISAVLPLLILQELTSKKSST